MGFWGHACHTLIKHLTINILMRVEILTLVLLTYTIMTTWTINDLNYQWLELSMTWTINDLNYQWLEP